MKTFLLRLLIFMLPIFITGAVFEVLLRKIPNDYSYKRNYLDRNSKTIRILVLGSSHTYYGINPNYMHNAFNAAHNSQSLDFDFKIIEKYIDRLDSIQFFVIPIDYHSLHYSLKSGVEAWRAKYYAIYYGIHSSFYLQDNSELLGSKLKPNMTRLYRYYMIHDVDEFWSPLGWGANYDLSNSKDLEATGLLAAKRHTSKDTSNFLHNKEILKRIVQIADRKNARIIFVTCPAYMTYVANLDNEQLSACINTATEFTRINSNVSYFNLLNDQTFNSHDFYDADHLNNVGAEKFTKKLDSLIRTLK